ncbi:MAG: DUF739 family protein [Clostridia bacterium]|nr:DUF739 family protein [Clostridia bacterium]
MNISELNAELARKNISIPELAKLMGVSKKLIYSRFKGETSFKHDEICKIVNILSLSQEKMMLIFFSKQVS